VAVLEYDLKQVPSKESVSEEKSIGGKRYMEQIQKQANHSAGDSTDLSARGRTVSRAQARAAECVAPNTQEPLLRIRPKSTWSFLEWHEVWDYRELLWTLACRDLKLRYRQTSLGILWVVLQPVAGAGVFSLVFGWVAGLATTKHSYFVFSLAGLLVWTAFQSTLSKSSMALLSNSALVSKVYFPRLLLPFSTVLSTLVDFAIGLCVFLVAGVCTGWHPTWTSLMWLPVWLLAAIAAALGAGLGAAAFMARYRDVQHALPMLLNFLMYASPVAYGLSAVPKVWRPFFEWNPVTWMLEGARAALLGTPSATGEWTAYTLLGSTALFVLGMFSFRKMERNFADVL
jgi:lipopolysaccharide transport system permease protein